MIRGFIHLYRPHRRGRGGLGVTIESEPVQSIGWPRGTSYSLRVGRRYSLYLLLGPIGLELGLEARRRRPVLAYEGAVGGR